MIEVCVCFSSDLGLGFRLAHMKFGPDFGKVNARLQSMLQHWYFKIPQNIFLLSPEFCKLLLARQNSGQNKMEAHLEC